ncbi:MAG: T9SS type A sorting domain-containing protein [Calditrichaeota bacterium]|nr:T9SS type A sorting domain-containing protein [Calditrichota bacterium]
MGRVKVSAILLALYIGINNLGAINGATFAIYVGPGAWIDGVIAFENFLDWKGISHERVTPTDVNTIVLKNYYQAIFMPGGDAYYYKLYIDSSGVQHIRDLVFSGGGYIGTCAGAYYASDSIRWEGGTYDYPLDLFQGFSNGAIDVIAPWPNYTMTPINMNPNNPINQYAPAAMTSLYYGGQTFVPHAGVQVDTLFTWAAYHDSVGGISFTYGSGRVLLMGIHPEIDENTNRDGTTFADSLDDRESDWNWLWTAIDWLLKKPLSTPQIWINEFHYDNAGTDENEFVEIVVPAYFTDLANVTLNLYDGATGTIYDSHTLNTFSAGLRQGDLQIYYKTIPGIQDGPDGFSLDYKGNLIQFISYEGTFTASTGIASGYRSTDIGVAESGTDAPGLSLQLLGSGTAYPDFSWGGPYGQTVGNVNSDGNTDQSLPVQLRFFRAEPQPQGVLLVWETASEINNLGFVLEKATEDSTAFQLLASYASHPALQGAGNSTQSRRYEFLDREVTPGQTYWYRLSDVSVSGQRTLLATIRVDGNSEDLPLANHLSPRQFRLYACYPNPFNPITTIAFDIAETADRSIPVRLDVFNTRGQRVATLLHTSLPPGQYRIPFDAGELPSGIYYYRLQAGHWVSTRKMVLLR